LFTYVVNGKFALALELLYNQNRELSFSLLKVFDLLVNRAITVEPESLERHNILLFLDILKPKHMFAEETITRIKNGDKCEFVGVRVTPSTPFWFLDSERPLIEECEKFLSEYRISDDEARCACHLLDTRSKESCEQVKNGAVLDRFVKENAVTKLHMMARFVNIDLRIMLVLADRCGSLCFDEEEARGVFSDISIPTRAKWRYWWSATQKNQALGLTLPACMPEYEAEYTCELKDYPFECREIPKDYTCVFHITFSNSVSLVSKLTCGDYLIQCPSESYGKWAMRRELSTIDNAQVKAVLKKFYEPTRWSTDRGLSFSVDKDSVNSYVSIQDIFELPYSKQWSETNWTEFDIVAYYDGVPSLCEQKDGRVTVPHTAQHVKIFLKHCVLAGHRGYDPNLFRRMDHFIICRDAYDRFNEYTFLAAHDYKFYKDDSHTHKD
jgi:hypothetical protein